MCAGHVCNDRAHNYMYSQSFYSYNPMVCNAWNLPISRQTPEIYRFRGKLLESTNFAANSWKIAAFHKMAKKAVFLVIHRSQHIDMFEYAFAHWTIDHFTSQFTLLTYCCLVCLVLVVRRSKRRCRAHSCRTDVLLENKCCHGDALRLQCVGD